MLYEAVQTQYPAGYDRRQEKTGEFPCDHRTYTCNNVFYSA